MPTPSPVLEVNPFPTLVTATPEITHAYLQEQAAVLVSGLERLARTERGDSSRWRRLLNQAQALSHAIDSTEELKPRSEFGILLREHRETAGLTQKALAARSGLSESFIRSIEGGRATVSRKSMDSFMRVKELRLEAQHLLPVTPAGNSSRIATPLNWWVAPKLDMVSMMEELKLRLNAPGGRVEQTFAYLDPQSAADYCSMTSDARYVATYRSPMPLEELAGAVISAVGRGPLDVVALGPGDGAQETRLIQGIINCCDEPDLRFYLLDISQSLLSKAHQHAKDQLDATRGVTVVGMWGNFHYLPQYDQIFYSPARRRRVFAMMGYTMSNLDDEPRFFRDSLRGAAPGDLVLLDLRIAYAPSHRPDEIREKDPALSKPVPEQVAMWLSGPFHRYLRKDARIAYHLDVDCPVPGSYSLDFVVDIQDPVTGDKKFSFTRSRRYDPDRLAECLSALGWDKLLYQPFGSSAVNTGVMLLRKRA